MTSNSPSLGEGWGALPPSLGGIGVGRPRRGVGRRREDSGGSPATNPNRVGVGEQKPLFLPNPFFIVSLPRWGFRQGAMRKSPFKWLEGFPPLI